MTVPGPAVASKPLLVVDDDPGLARALQILLEDERPYQVLAASSAAEALRSLSDHAGVAVVICDAALPGAGNLGLAELLRRRHPALEVVVMTALEPTSARTRDTVLEGCPSVRKPVDPAELLEVLDRLVGG
jgi:DNA-binding NtrC family response regulator